jgi:geranylgeranyl diphosphate synthase type I
MSTNSIDAITQTYLEAIEDELQKAVKRANNLGNTELHDMLAYHMGWQGDRKKIESRGKRIRPLLVLLSCSAAGGDWTRALPGATAVELVHNFSLIHDDIEDHSLLRRGRPTIWNKWGIPQAINTGDAMFALAHLEAIRLSNTVSPSIALKAVELLQSTCLHLTQGQYLDLSYETRNDLSIDDYWQMVEGKTAALMAVSTEMGALAAYRNETTSSLYHKFGWKLGLAFQVQDDFLGIWGNSSLTGKSSQSDLVTGKITLPILFGLSKDGKFAARWKKGLIQPGEVSGLINLLEIEGGKEFTQSQAKLLSNEALASLAEAHPSGIAGEALYDLAVSLLNRQS